MQQEFILSLKFCQEYIVNNIQEKPLEIVLVEGSAEIFGREMILHREYNFKQGERFFIFTWNEGGCKIKMNQENPGYNPNLNESANIENHPMVFLLNVHSYLQHMRLQALQNQKHGPIILITGSPISGKTTVSKILINYACKLRNTPIFVDLDIEKNDIMCGGILGACVCDQFYPDNFISQQDKILFYTGFKQLSNECIDQYIEQVKSLGNAVLQKMEHDLAKYKKKLSENAKFLQQYSAIESPPQFSSGCIISLPYIKKQHRQKALDAIISEFQVDTVLVIEDDEQYIQLSQIYKDSKLILKSSKLKSVIRDEDDSYANKKESQQVQIYFNGLNNQIKSKTYQIKFSEINLFQIKKLQMNQASMVDSKNNIVAERIDLEQKQQIGKNIIGVLHKNYNPNDYKDLTKFALQIIQTPLALLCHVDQINTHSKVITILVPNENYKTEDLASKIWVIGNLVWVGSVDM